MNEKTNDDQTEAKPGAQSAELLPAVSGCNRHIENPMYGTFRSYKDNNTSLNKFIRNVSMGDHVLYKQASGSFYDGTIVGIDGRGCRIQNGNYFTVFVKWGNIRSVDKTVDCCR